MITREKIPGSPCVHVCIPEKSGIEANLMHCSWSLIGGDAANQYGVPVRVSYLGNLNNCMDAN